MAQPFTAKLGTFDFSDYLRVGEDVAPTSMFEEPAFSEAPLAEGQPLISLNAKNREMAWPLFLNAASKDALHTLIQTANRACKQQNVTLEWKDAGASQSTFYDVAYARFEPAYNYRRGVQGWLAGTLRVDCAPPYGHTASERIIATAVGTGPVLTMAIPSAIRGDVDALTRIRVTLGSQAPWRGDDFFAVAELPHGSYSPVIPAASFTQLTAVGGAPALVGASGALASQFMGATIAYFQPGDQYSIRAPLPIPSVYAGRRHRVLGLTRGGIWPYTAISARDPGGRALGPTALATTPWWGLVDLGVLSVPSNPPASYAMEFRVGVPTAFDFGNGGYDRQFGLNAVVLLPEESMTWLIDRPGRPITAAADDYSTGVTGGLMGQQDLYGNTYATVAGGHGLGNAAPIKTIGGGFGFLTGSILGATALFSGVALPDLALTSMRAAMRISTCATIHASHAYFIDKAMTTVGAQPLRVFTALTLGTAPSLSLQGAQSGGGPTLLGSLGIAATSLLPPKDSINFDYIVGAELLLEARDGAVTGTLRQYGRTLINSLGSQIDAAVVTASFGMIGAGRVEYGLFHASSAAGGLSFYPIIHGFMVEGPIATNIQPQDAITLDTTNGDAFRQTVASVYVEDLTADVRGAGLRLSPSAPAIAVLSHPQRGGPANDQLNAEIRVRERFTYAR